MRTRLIVLGALSVALVFGFLCLADRTLVCAQEQPAQTEENGAQDAQGAQDDGGVWDPGPDFMSDFAAPVETQPLAQSSEPVPSAPPENAGMIERPPVAARAERSSDRISFNFSNASLDSVVGVIVRAANLKYVKTSPLTGAVTISNLAPVTVDEAIDIVDTILHAQGSAFVRQGDMLTIVPLDSIKTLATPVYQGTADFSDGSMPKGAQMITWVQPLRNADATKVAKDLANLVPKHGSLAANQASNTLVITDTGAGVQRLLRIVTQLDSQAKGSLFDVRLFTLRYADATDVANVVRQIFVDQSPAQMGNNMRMAMEQRMRATGGGGAVESAAGSNRDVVKVAANTDTNSVVVAATSENLDLIGKMVSEIDTVAGGSPQSIGIFHLENADCQELTNVLKTVMGIQAQSTTTPSRTNQQGNRGRQQGGVRNTGGATTRGATTNGTQPGRPSSLRPSNLGGGAGGGMGGGSSRGPSSKLDNSGEILVWPVDSLAQAGPAGDAAAAARAVRPGVGMSVRRAATANAATTAAAEEAALRRKPVARNADIVITYDDRTGTVIVSAPEETMGLIRSIVEELDRDPAEKYISQVYHLNNADATNLSGVLTAIFSGTSAVGGGVAQEMRGNVTVVPDTTSNSLIITSAPRNFERIYQLVKDLDQAPPQVMIQAVLVEVTLNKGSKIGLVNARLDFDEVLPQRQFGFGDATIFWSYLNDKVDGFIDLLQTEGSVEVLSRPQILASDNKQAQINVGQSVPFVTRVQTTEAGNTINTIQYQDIGIILNVTPHINPEGYVNMDVTPQISNFADSSVNVGNNVQAAVFTNRAAQTTVAIKDGQTIVIGGLMANEDRKTIRAIPVLSKIPLIGPILFQHTEISKVKTDLLVILTPKVIRSDEDAQRISAEERTRSAMRTDGRTENQIDATYPGIQSTPIAETPAPAPSISPAPAAVQPQAAPQSPDVKLVPFPTGGDQPSSGEASSTVEETSMGGADEGMGPDDDAEGTPAGEAPEDEEDMDAEPH